MLFPGRRHTLIHDFCSRATLIKRDCGTSYRLIRSQTNSAFSSSGRPTLQPPPHEWRAGPVTERGQWKREPPVPVRWRSPEHTRLAVRSGPPGFAPQFCPIRRSGCRTVVSVRLANAAPGRKEVWPIVRHLRCLDDAILGVFRDGTCRRGVVQSRGNRAGSKAEVVSDGFEGDSRFRTRGLLLPQRLGRLRGPPRMNRRNIQSHVAHTMA